MKYQTIASIAAGAMLFGCTSHQSPSPGDLTRWVNPFIGTDFTGNTYPGAQAPFGMVQLSPDNGLPGWDRIAGYFYPDSTIAGFSHTHLSGTGAGDLYDISFMPVTIPYVVGDEPLGIYSKFSHSSEEAQAGYYRVTLDDYDIDVELTATPRAGIQRYTFPEAQSAIILNLTKATNWDATVDTHIEVIDSVTIAGYRFSKGWARDQRVYFYTRLSRPFDSIQLDTTEVNKDDKPGLGINATMLFDTKKGDRITVSTAISSTGIEGAKANLLAEVPTDDFDHYREKAREAWNSELRHIEVESDDPDKLTTFYTALYHSMIAPTIFSDTDGSYRGPDGNIYKTSGTNYGTFSLWDTYRAAHPLYTIIDPARANDMVKSMIDFYSQNGRLPVWSMWAGETDMMIGYHAVPVIADAYLKGIGDFDPEKALEACVATANLDNYRGIGQYKTLGYIPYDLKDEYNSENWSLSKTLEYAYDDWCIAQMAKKMGRDDIYKEFSARALNYRNVLNPATGFMQPRAASGEFQPDFKPEDYTPHICESNAWHYLWSVQHDVPALRDLIGGSKAFEARLDSLFGDKIGEEEELPIFSTGMIGQYAHGNEPSHHVAYLYNVAGNPSKSQKRLKEIMDAFYTNTPAGLCGNEDCGQMSAWYVFSALGFYPVNPASGIYEIGTPTFRSAKIHLDNGKTFTMSAPQVSDRNIYIKSVKVNGQPYNKSYITHSQILDGATVEFEMTGDPSGKWYDNY